MFRARTSFIACYQGGVRKRCRLSLLTNSALVYESQCRGMGSYGVSANEYSCAHHVTWSPNKLWRSTSIFNLWFWLKTIRHRKFRKSLGRPDPDLLAQSVIMCKYLQWCPGTRPSTACPPPPPPPPCPPPYPTRPRSWISHRWQSPHFIHENLSSIASTSTW